MSNAHVLELPPLTQSSPDLGNLAHHRMISELAQLRLLRAEARIILQPADGLLFSGHNLRWPLFIRGDGAARLGLGWGLPLRATRSARWLWRHAKQHVETTARGLMVKDKIALPHVVQ